MAIVAGFANISRMDYLTTLGSHNLYVALYLQASASMDLNTPTYTATGEISGAGYVAGGKLLTGAAITQVGNTAILAYDNPRWTGASFSTNAAIIYDATNGNHILALYTFSLQTPAAIDFLLVMNNGAIEAA